MWQSAMPPPEPPLATRRVGVFVTLWNEEASTGATANLSGMARFGGFWPGFAYKTTTSDLWWRASGTKGPTAEAACSSCKKTQKNQKSHWEPLQRLQRGFFLALCPLIIHLNRQLGMCFWINNWKGGQLINKTNWAIYYLGGSPFIIWCEWRWVHSSGLQLCFAQSPNWWLVPNYQL